MSLLISLLIAILFAVGFDLVLQRSITRIILGILVLSNVTNLFIFVVPSLVKSAPPIMAEKQDQLAGVFADPLPQALILTAIVIGMGIVAFLLGLANRISEKLKISDIDEMREE
jgi:multicomponent Na+:H+ antiporter subunit C